MSSHDANSIRTIDAATAEESLAERRQRDLQLVKAILAGDAEAFDQLHALYSQRIYRFALKRLRDPMEAEDVTQDVFMQIHRSLRSYEGRSSLLTWMFGIAHHQVCRRFRRRTPILVPMDGVLESVLPAEGQISAERRLDAMRVLASCEQVLEREVADNHRDIFHRYYIDHAATKEIAKEIGKSTQAVKISLFRSRRTLEAQVEGLDQLLSA